MDDHPTEHQPAVAARKAREAAALKENLRRRKAQARAAGPSEALQVKPGNEASSASIATTGPDVREREAD